MSFFSKIKTFFQNVRASIVSHIGKQDKAGIIGVLRQSGISISSNPTNAEIANAVVNNIGSNVAFHNNLINYLNDKGIVMDIADREAKSVMDTYNNSISQSSITKSIDNMGAAQSAADAASKILVDAEESDLKKRLSLELESALNKQDAQNKSVLASNDIADSAKLQRNIIITGVITISLIATSIFLYKKYKNKTK